VNSDAYFVRWVALEQGAPTAGVTLLATCRPMAEPALCQCVPCDQPSLTYAPQRHRDGRHRCRHPSSRSRGPSLVRHLKVAGGGLHKQSPAWRVRGSANRAARAPRVSAWCSLLGSNRVGGKRSSCSAGAGIASAAAAAIAVTAAGAVIGAPRNTWGYFNRCPVRCPAAIAGSATRLSTCVRAQEASLGVPVPQLSHFVISAVMSAP
jgi:hypothetical protein